MDDDLRRYPVLLVIRYHVEHCSGYVIDSTTYDYRGFPVVLMCYTYRDVSLVLHGKANLLLYPVRVTLV